MGGTVEEQAAARAKAETLEFSYQAGSMTSELEYLAEILKDREETAQSTRVEREMLIEETLRAVEVLAFFSFQSITISKRISIFKLISISISISIFIPIFTPIPILISSLVGC
jgi:hypothetical protein